MMPILALLFAGVLWGGVGTASRFAVDRGVTPDEIAFWRAAIAGVVFTLWNLARVRQIPEKKDLGWLVAFALFGLGLLVLSNQKAVALGGAGFAAIFLYSAPIWVALYQRLFERELPNALKQIALVLTLGGVAGVGVMGGEVNFTPGALAWGVISGLSYAALFVLGRRFYAKYPAVVWNGLAFLIAALVFAPFIDFQPKDSVAWMGIAYAGVASTVLSYLFYSWGLRRTNPTTASILCSTEPVVAIVSAYFVWGEKLSLLGYASSALVLVGVSCAAIAEREKPRSA